MQLVVIWLQETKTIGIFSIAVFMRLSKSTVSIMALVFTAAAVK